MTQFRTDASRENIMDAVNTDRGSSTEIEIRSGTPDGNGGEGTVLAELTGNAGGWGTSTNGVLTSSAITADASADATGTANHYQLNTSGSVFIESGLCDAGGTDGVTIDNVSIVAGQTVQMNGNWVNTAAYDDGI